MQILKSLNLKEEHSIATKVKANKMRGETKDKMLPTQATIC